MANRDEPLCFFGVSSWFQVFEQAGALLIRSRHPTSQVTSSHACARESFVPASGGARSTSANFDFSQFRLQPIFGCWIFGLRKREKRRKKDKKKERKQFGCPPLGFRVNVNRIPPDAAIHEHLTIVDNNMNDATHVDMRNMQN